MPLDLNTAVGAGRDDDAGDSSTASAPPTPTGDSLDSKVDEEVIAPSSPPVAGDRDVQKEAILHARAYQLEMHEESLKRNIIVAVSLVYVDVLPLY